MDKFLYWFARTSFGKWWCEGNIHIEKVSERFYELIFVILVLCFVLLLTFSKKIRKEFF